MLLTYESVEELRASGHRVLELTSAPREDLGLVNELRALGAPLYLPVRYASTTLAVAGWIWRLAETADQTPNLRSRVIVGRAIRIGLRLDDPGSFVEALFAVASTGEEEDVDAYLDSVAV